jgi:hypothetical protein
MQIDAYVCMCVCVYVKKNIIIISFFILITVQISKRLLLQEYIKNGRRKKDRLENK